MEPIKASENIDKNRRRLLGTAAMSIAVAGAASLLPAHTGRAVEGDAIRPFRVNIPEEAARRSPPAHCGDAVARKETVTDDTAGRAARDDAETRALLADGVRLAQDRGAG